jgi:hypothetical protein
MERGDSNTLKHGQLEGKIHRKHFLDYFVDSAFFASDATEVVIGNQGDQERQKRFTRSAILNSALCVEAAANCCLNFLQLQRPSHDDYEQLKTLAKFDLFLHYVKPTGILDREHKLVRPIRNLLSCRNEYVHSKVVVDNMEANRHISKMWEPLGLPHNSGLWQPIHSVKVFTVMSDFLNHFFFELCGLPYEGHKGRGFVADILNSGISSNEDAKLAGGIRYSSLQNNSTLSTTFIGSKWDLDFAFLGIYSTGSGNTQTFPKRKLGDYSHCDLTSVQIPPQIVTYRTPDGFSFGILNVEKTSSQ